MEAKNKNHLKQKKVNFKQKEGEKKNRESAYKGR